MTSSNRVINRMLLALVGLAALVAAAYVTVRAYPALIPTISIPALPAVEGAALWYLAGASGIVVALSIAWIVTRGRGSTHDVIHENTPFGVVEVDVRVVSDLVSAQLANRQDIVGVSVNAYRVRRAATLALTVTVRSGADIERVRDDVALAVAEVDTQLESRLPVVVHITGARIIRAREKRVS
ncbi:hypothetical protein M2152_000298 [Microbacteriaceae bacterium SG_E_30_P1]|uniref:Alkaline shock response membrane anchor protein AmaP n=1 Tax=Antiquaquibacter oligotrophicus TaxID=2880260 RepID=A0ABT6KK82_9MICO|nr:hypothetical protein [Antiquaquibacter oligotrophicus]MDH6180116.1 hypothetical protein [Antiquaquibacter oligotrophicus]UDF14133.1 hypothetical protein LH407_04550 [Antiquaquibacter oligotrophicus]